MELLKEVGFVRRGKNRRIVFESLGSPAMPSELVVKIYRKRSNTCFNLVSRALRELKERGLVEVVNPDDKTGRIYRRTKRGEKVVVML
jgi:hypothetical protein